MKRITVYIITYNQEAYIKRTLDSVLRQKAWGLHRIVISDDCSKDSTWDILKQYKSNYPDIIDIHRNDHNLGIIGNTQKVFSLLPDSDLYGDLAGDDEYCDGYFESVQNFIENNHINTKNAIGIFSDWVCVDPDGNSTIYKQNSVLSGHNLWSLKVRGKIGVRSLLYSSSVKNRFDPILVGYGLNLTESHFDSQALFHIDEIYYFSKVTSVYYMGIGVSSFLTIKNSDYYTVQSIEKWQYGLSHYVNNPQDRHYAQYEILKAEYYLKPSLIKIPRIYYHFVKSQLQGCKDSLSTVIGMLVNLIKYKFSFYR